MPIYEYRCSECQFQEEYLQKVSEPPLTVCPSCSKATFKKLLSAAGFQLKGSGWYATDFRNSGAKKESGKAADVPSASGEKPAGESKSESKSEPAATAKSESSTSTTET